MFRRAVEFLKDVLFPISCVECGRDGEWWCEECLQSKISKPILHCPVCGSETPTGSVCESCRGESALDGAAALFAYDAFSPVGRLLKQFKYSYASDLSALWERLWKIFLETPVLPKWGDFTIVPVPLYPRRERERGFNQAEVLARLFLQVARGVQIGCNYNNSLKRVRYTKQQARLSGDARRRNLQGAFVWSETKSPPARILLIDDVFTTGATMQECARALKQKGAQSVWSLTIARG